jgi:hypothetical protein
MGVSAKMATVSPSGVFKKQGVKEEFIKQGVVYKSTLFCNDQKGSLKQKCKMAQRKDYTQWEVLLYTAFSTIRTVIPLRLDGTLLVSAFSRRLINSTIPCVMAALPFSIENLLSQPQQSVLKRQILNAWAINLALQCAAPKRASVDFSTSDSKQKFECKECGKLFTAQYNLTRHLPVHTGARPFQCKVGFRLICCHNA